MKIFISMFALMMFGVLSSLLVDLFLRFVFGFSLQRQAAFTMIIVISSVIAHQKIKNPQNRYLYVGIVSILVAFLKLM